MADELRTCGRTGCRWPAAASLSFRYSTRQVWLLDLSVEPDPSLYDLCPPHADHLTVPRGWERVDQRTHPPAQEEPAGHQLARDPAAGQPALAGAAQGGNRYADLSRALPRIAASLGTEQVGEAGRVIPLDERRRPPDRSRVNR